MCLNHTDDSFYFGYIAQLQSKVMAHCSIEEASSKEIIYIKYFFTLGYLILHQMRKFTHKNRYTNGVLLQETDVRDKKCLNHTHSPSNYPAECMYVYDGS